MPGGDVLSTTRRSNQTPQMGTRSPSSPSERTKMNNRDTNSSLPTDAPPAETAVQSHWNRVVGRRSFLKGVGLAGAAVLPGSALLASQAMAAPVGRLTGGDVAIL